MTAALALALLSLAAAGGGRLDAATNSSSSNGGPNPGRVPGVPNLDATLLRNEAARDLTVDGSLVPTEGTVTVPELPADGQAAAARRDDVSAAPSVISQEVGEGQSVTFAHERPAAPDAEDLGARAAAHGQVHAAANDGSGVAAAADPTVPTADGKPATAYGAAQVVADRVTQAPEGAAGALTHFYTDDRLRPESPVAQDGGAGRAALPAAGSPVSDAEAYLSGLGFSRLSQEAPFLPDAMRVDARDLVRTLGPESADFLAREIAARQHSQELDARLTAFYAPLRHTKADGGGASAKAPLPAWVEEIVAPWKTFQDTIDATDAGIKRAHALDTDTDKPLPRDHDQETWWRLWKDNEFRGIARRVLQGGRHFTPLTYRRFLLGLLEYNGARTFREHRYRELAGHFAEAFLQGSGLTWEGYQRDFLPLRKEDPKYATQKKTYESFTTVMEEYGPYIKAALDLILISAPSEDDIPYYTTSTLTKVAKILGPAFNQKERPSRRRGKKRTVRLVSFDESGRRQFFFETLLKTLYPDYRLEIRMGMGGSDDAPSIRLFSYAIPALEQLRNFRRNGVTPPTMIIFNAQPMSQDINQLDPATSRANAELANYALRAFIRTFYPDVAEYVRVEMRTLEQLHMHPFQENIIHLRDLRAGRTPATLKKDRREVLLRDLDKMVAQALEHGKDLNPELARDRAIALDRAIAYVSGHPLPEAFGNIQLVQALFDGSRLPPHGIVEYGGPGETSFFRLQNYLANLYLTYPHSLTFLVNTAFGSIDFKTGRLTGKPAASTGILGSNKVGTKPPYYHQNGGGGSEITLLGIPAQFRALGITNADGILRYYKEHFIFHRQGTRKERDPKTGAVTEVPIDVIDDSVPYDVEVLLHMTRGRIFDFLQTLDRAGVLPK